MVDRGGPSLLLARGNYTVTGRFEWSSRPESLPVSASSAIVDLTVDGLRIAQPERPDGAIWLGKRRNVEQAAAMEVQVYRLLKDEIPAYLFTSIRLNVAGDAREELLARVLPDGFVPLGLTGPLPARLERDGTLRVQVRPGSYTLLLAARGTGVAGTLTRPDASGGAVGPRGNLELRVQRRSCASRRPRARMASIPRRRTCRRTGARFRPFAWTRNRS